MKIIITDHLPPEIVKELFESFTVKEHYGIKKDELLQKIHSFDIIVVRSETKVDKDVINAGVNLKMIARAGVGVDNIDVDYATKKGIIVINSPGGNTIAAAEHTIAHILNLSRNISIADQYLKRGKWERKKFMGKELFGKTLGVVGLGRIGSTVAKIANGLNMKIIAYDPFVLEEEARRIGVELVNFEELLSQSDYITLHIPHNRKTHHIISAKEISKMKDGVRIINCARGGLINEKDLYEALKNSKVSGAALDVFEIEPPVDNLLLELENIVATPHLGASTYEAQVAVAKDIASQIKLFAEQKPLTNAVNLPSIPSEGYNELLPFFQLGEKLGKLQSLLVHDQIKLIQIMYHGDISSHDTSFITRYILVGFLRQMFDENINYVNAQIITKERGIKILETTQIQDTKFRNLITLTVVGQDSKLAVSGTYLGEGGIRILRIDDYWIDFVPEGMILIIWYKDIPGVIGRIGTFLGSYNINIAGMQVGRREIRGEAVMALSVDNEVPEILIPAIEKLEGVHRIEVINF